MIEKVFNISLFTKMIEKLEEIVVKVNIYIFYQKMMKCKKNMSKSGIKSAIASKNDLIVNLYAMKNIKLK